MARRLHVPPVHECVRTAALLAAVCVLFLCLLFWTNKALLLVLRSCTSGKFGQSSMHVSSALTTAGTA